MSLALSAGVTGLQAHQKMLDVAGNNLANVNTTAFKASSITFSELLSETVKKASQPTSTVGGTNPQQMGTGVGIAGISPNMTQGSIVNTGNPLDLALEGEGYFVVSDGQQGIFTRAGAFAVDANSIMVDPATGYRVQRIGATGEADGFQVAGDSDLHVPFGTPMPAQLTSTITITGNLSSDATLATAQTQILGSDISYTSGGTQAVGTTLISNLDQYSGTLNSGTITFSGYKPDGTALGSTPTTDLTMPVTATTTVNDILTWLNTDEGTAAVAELQTMTTDALATAGTFTLTYNGETTGNIAYDAPTTGVGSIQEALEALSGVSAGDITVGGTGVDTAGTTTFTFLNTADDVPLITFDLSGLTGPSQAGSSMAETTTGRAVQGVLGSTAVASLLNGQLRITDAASGYSRSDLAMAYSGDGTLTMPGYFEMLTVGGEEVKGVNIMVFDSQGGKHVFSGALVRTGTANTWDMVMSSMSGNISQVTIPNRRIENITFDATNGYYTGVTGGASNPAEFVVSFAHDPLNPQTISLDFGSVGQLNGLTQFAGNSTAVAKDQDGYEAGQLSSVSVDNTGIVIGAFSNGIKKDVGAVQISLFQNTAGLESIGNGYYTSSANSGVPVATQAMSGGAGSVHGGSLEKSNSDVATQFVSMIQAQNGFQANARTIRVANDILRELSSLIR
ncbi:MAG: flagellar hook-basal body complex protein [Planctomycetes bacterium]|nr:flagellar hook-basal body complex protein [Planctomycetota bacterium]